MNFNDSELSNLGSIANLEAKFEKKNRSVS